ncbi:hypothetical protein PVAP13_5KG346307 [Panicum virgatum]|uniref:Uncharacterized protein n=1 Tax=Panicum virgatum TaxID=38727 RepID=A0A8T0SK04_PANVG|nr:hypothetical protein PVAP13_5KG346307 [Panicum virgatum]
MVGEASGRRWRKRVGGGGAIARVEAALAAGPSFHSSGRRRIRSHGRRNRSAAGRGCAATTLEPGRARARGRATPTLGLGLRPVRRLDPRRGRTAASTRANAEARPRPRPAPPGAPTPEPDRLDPRGRAALPKEMRETRVGRKR